MPPKKKGEKGKAKGGAKKSASGRALATIDGVPMKNMTKDQLEGHVLRLRSEIDREREERGFVQSEMERVQRLWSVSADKLEESRTLLRFKDAEMAEAEKARLEELRVSQQQMKNVMDERETSIGTLQIQSEQSLLSLHKEHIEEKNRLIEEREELKNELRQSKSSFLTLFANIKVNHSRDLDEMRNAFEEEAKQCERQHSDRIHLLQEELDLKRKSQLAKEQEEKSAFLAKVISNHENEMELVRKQSSEVTNANLRLITQLRAQLADQRSQSLQNTQQTAKEEQEKISLTNECQQTKKKLADAERLLQRYKHQESNMKITENSLKKLKAEKTRLKNDLEVSLKDAKEAKKERDELHANFLAVVADVHQRSQMKTTLLEKRMTQLSQQLEKRESVLSEVAKASNLDLKSFGSIESIIDEKNKLVSNLQEDIASLRRMYVELLDKSPKSS